MLGGFLSATYKGIEKLAAFILREKKAVKYSSSTHTVIGTGLAGWEHLLTIQWGEAKIESIFLHRIYIRNTGNKEVKDIAVNITLSPNAFLMFPSVTPENCLSIDPNPEGVYNTFKAKIDFINPKDRITITVNEVNGVGKSPTVSARAAGTSCEYEVWKEERRLAAKVGGMLGAIVVVVGAVMCTIWTIRAVAWTWNHLIPAAVWLSHYITKLKQSV